MTGRDFEWLAERARSGELTARAYDLNEAYPGERAELVRELRTALAGCPDTGSDRFARMMREAIDLNALPVLRAVVALWRDAYRNLLDHLDKSFPAPALVHENALLSNEERARLTAFKRERERERR